MSKTLEKTNGCSGVLGAPAIQNDSVKIKIPRACERNAYFFVYASPFGRGGGVADGEGSFVFFPLSTQADSSLGGRAYVYSYSDLR